MAPFVYPEEKNEYEKNDSKLHRTSKFEIDLDKYLEVYAQTLRTSKNYLLYTDPASYIGIEEIKVLFNIPVYRVFEEQQIIAYSASKTYSNESRIWIDMDGEYCYCDIDSQNNYCAVEGVGRLSTKDLIQSDNHVKDNERLNYIIDGIREYEESVKSKCKCGRLFQRIFPFTIYVVFLNNDRIIDETIVNDIGEITDCMLPTKYRVSVHPAANNILIRLLSGGRGVLLQISNIKQYTEGLSLVELMFYTELDDSIYFQFRDFESLKSSSKLRIGNCCCIPGLYKSVSRLFDNGITI